MTPTNRDKLERIVGYIGMLALIGVIIAVRAGCINL